MDRRSVLAALMIGAGLAVFGAPAAASEDKGRRRDGREGSRGRGGSRAKEHGRGRRGKRDEARRRDEGRRHLDYAGGRRDHRGRPHGRDDYADLVHAGITAALARQYARDYGLHGYAALPPGIRKSLARGRRLPPGMARRRAPKRMLGRLPRYPGYEWRVSGTDLILVALANSMVADILYDVFD